MAEDQNGAQQDAQPAGTGTDPGQQTGAQGGEDRAFSQADVDRIVQERLNRQKQQYADYDDLKSAAAKLQELEDAQKSELDKANERLARLQATNAELLQKQQDLTLRSAITSEAVKLNFADPEDAWRLLDLSLITVNEDGEVEGVAEALGSLAEGKKYLLRQQAVSMSPTALQRGKQTGESDADKRKRLWGGGAPNLGDPELGGGVYWPTKTVE